jgi:hypothetical protein
MTGEERADVQHGRVANIAGKPFDVKQNVDWQRGWLDANDERKDL